MGTPQILYQDFVEDVTAIIPPTITPSEPRCSICKETYGSFGPGPQSNLDFLSELPGAHRKTYVQRVVEPVKTPCGHNFCTWCLALWLSGLSDKELTCPICRQTVMLPEQLHAWQEELGDNPRGIAVNGLRSSLHVSPDTAEQIFDIVKISYRQLLTTQTSMPMLWDADVMIRNLPKVMVAIARRFNRSSRSVVPADLPYLRLSNPLTEARSKRSINSKALAYFSFPMVPLLKHPDAQKLYDLLSAFIKSLEKAFERTFRYLEDWESGNDLLWTLTLDEMAYADGGMTNKEWREYMKCVVKTLVVWQAYSERARRLSRNKVPQPGPHARMEGSVLVYRLA